MRVCSMKKRLFVCSSPCCVPKLRPIVAGGQSLAEDVAKEPIVGYDSLGKSGHSADLLQIYSVVL